ncbi:MAG: RNA polymerase primary sigma factor [Cognaticolwellia sp.]|jgi:RNA polymerase primary sigma factor
MTIEHEDQGIGGAGLGMDGDTELGLALLSGEAHFFALLSANFPELEIPEDRADRLALGRELAAAGRLAKLGPAWQKLDVLRWQLAAQGADMVSHMVRRLGRTHAREDLESVAWMGLFQAACQWEPERGLRFTTLARWTVRSELNQALERHGRLVRVPGTAHLRLRKLRREMEEASLSQAAARMEMSTARASKLLAQAGGKGVPFEAEDVPGLSLSETLAAKQPDVVDAIDGARNAKQIALALKGLSERDRQVISAYFGLDGDPRSFRHIGEEIGVSGERVRQLYHRATARIRSALP